MARTYELSTVFSAVDRMTRPLQRMTRSITGFSQSARVALNGVVSSTKKVGESFEKLAARSGIVAGGAAFIGSEIAESTVKMNSITEAVGQNIDTITALSKPIKNLGFDFENVTDLAEEMTNKLGESRGMGEMTESTADGLKLMGMSFAEVKDLAPDQQFEKIISRLLEMEDASKAQAAADVLMGSEANRVIGALRNQGLTLDQLKKKSAENNFLTKEGIEGSKTYVNSINRLKSVTGSLTQQFIGLVGNALSPTIEKYSNLITANKELINSRIDQFIQGFTDNIGPITSFAKVVGGTVAALGFFKMAAFAATTAANIFGVGLSIIKIPIILTTGLIKGLTTVIRLSTMAFRASPVGFIVGAFTAIIGVGVLLYKNWETIKETFSAVGGVLAEIGKAIFQLVTGDFESLMKFPEKIAEKWGDLTKIFSGVGDSIKGLGNDILDFVGLGDDEVTPQIGSPDISQVGINNAFVPNIGQGPVIQAQDAANMTTSTTSTNIQRSEVLIKDQTGKAEMQDPIQGVTLQYSGGL